MLAEQAIAFDVDTVVIGDEQCYKPLCEALENYPIKVFAGDDSIAAVASASNCDTVVNALVGYAGLIPTARAIEAHKRIALANKETLVVGGATIMPMAIQHKAPILPIDSEHSAIFQCLIGENSPLRRLIITCSGGALRDVPKEKIADTLRVSGRHVSVDAPFVEGEDNSLLDVLVNNDSPSADRGLVNESLNKEIERALSTLATREREIIKSFFGIGCQEMTLEEIGERFGLTRERVRQIKEKAIRKLKNNSRSKLLKSYLG